MDGKDKGRENAGQRIFERVFYKVCSVTLSIAARPPPALRATPASGGNVKLLIFPRLPAGDFPEKFVENYFGPFLFVATRMDSGWPGSILRRTRLSVSGFIPRNDAMEPTLAT